MPASSRSPNLGVDLVQAWSVIRSFFPALLHQLDAHVWPKVSRHLWPAQGRGRCHLPDDFCNKHHVDHGPEILKGSQKGKS